LLILEQYHESIPLHLLLITFSFFILEFEYASTMMNDSD